MSSMKKPKYKVRILEDELKVQELCHNVVHQVKPSKDELTLYETEEAKVICRLIGDLCHQVKTKGVSFAQQFILQQGLKKFGQKGQEAALKELDQLYKRNCFTPISVKEMTAMERRKAQQALMFLTEKRDESIKGRMVYNGKPTREWLSREDCNSPTAALESIMLTCVIDAHEERDVMTCDIPNAFIQAEMPEIRDGKERVMMKITGVLVDLLMEMDPNLYGPMIVFENGKKVVYVLVLRAIYGMLEAALLWYKKFKKELEGAGFTFNPYDPCVANRIIKGDQQTIVFHVDDLKSSHKNSKVNDEFEHWLNKKYGDHGKVASKRGKVHDYLGMVLDYSEKGAVKIDMRKYVKDMLNAFPIKLDSKMIARTPSGDKIFEQGPGKALEKERQELFHTFVAKALFLTKRGRPDIQQAIALLCTRVKSPSESDWNKLVRVMKYLNYTKDKVLRVKVDDPHVIKWYVDAAFAVHPDFRSHTGAVMTMGEGSLQTISRKQKLNTRSSTESELVGVDDVSTMILWTKLFLEAQGLEIKKNIVFQDNKSAILLEVNGKKSAGKRSRALNIRYFFVTDQAEKGNLHVEYCPTDQMVGDYFTKPLQGGKFSNFRKIILGEVDNGERK
jgi:Reverse transcriptase (RNA-dependent DNA polymerase)